MVLSHKVNDDLRHSCANNLFLVFSLYCIVGRSLVLVLAGVFYCLMVVIGEMKRGNTKCECIGGYKILKLAMGVVGSVNMVWTNKVDFDLSYVWE